MLGKGSGFESQVGRIFLYFWLISFAAVVAESEYNESDVQDVLGNYWKVVTRLLGQNIALLHQHLYQDQGLYG